MHRDYVLELVDKKQKELCQHIDLGRDYTLLVYFA